ncbi:hypothetical protein NSA47_09015 [Irregularibacter muris]|uniref:Mannitol-1-phosphate 5-dehydrogenase n=1 Tax=Irregularibacter muris TaxID=1796619 RepID=A0AAE3HGM3_9FIRM|nr:hypothetical protein [Irregularibacter muris]MCR1899122.1 hypothetical protein [Irregularibacter muris]
MSNTIIHFGGGALGRGLVIPLIVGSGYEVILADTNEALLHNIKENMSYTLDITDAKKNRYRKIFVQNVLSCTSQEERLISLLQEVDTVTTSVRRENLKHVAKILVKAWKDEDISNKKVICCENIEHVSSYFQELLLKQDLTMEQKTRISQICIPDTIVDRICSATDDLNLIKSEMFYECSVDAKQLPNTGIKYITSVSDIDIHFARKRFLMNSYADAISFFALSKGIKYLHDAAKSNEINDIVKPFITLLKTLLRNVYKIDEDELDKWANCYRNRLTNNNILRDLHTVARNIIPKLSLEERFLSPLIQAKNNGIEIEEGVAFLKELIFTENKMKDSPLSRRDLLDKLKELWASNEDGRDIFKMTQELLKDEI